MLAILKRRSPGVEFSKTSTSEDLEKDKSTPVDDKSVDTDKVPTNDSASDKAGCKPSENSDKELTKDTIDVKIAAETSESAQQFKVENKKCVNSTAECLDRPLVIKEEPVSARTPDYDEIIVPVMVKRETPDSIATETRTSTPNSCIKQVKMEQVDEEPVRVCDLSKLANVSQYHQSMMANSKIYQQQVVGGPNEPLRLCDLTKLVQTAGDNYHNRMAAANNSGMMHPEDMDGDMITLEEDDDDARSMDSGHNNSGHGSGQNGGLEKKRRKPVPLNTLCPICGNPAPGHSHFGGMCCYSCRAFFRRTSTRPLTSFKCRGGENNCEVTAGSKCCIRCRLRKCLQAGMDPSLIKGRRVGRRSNLGSGEPVFRGGNPSPHSHSEHTLAGGAAVMRYPEQFKENNCGGVMRPVTSVIRSIGNSGLTPHHATGGVLIPGHGHRMDERAHLEEQLSPSKRPAPRGIAISILNRPAQDYSNGYLYNKNMTNNYRAALPTPPSPPMQYTRSPPTLQETAPSRHSVFPYNGGHNPTIITSKDHYTVMPKLMPIYPPHQPPTPPSLEPTNLQFSSYHNSTMIGGDRRLSYEQLPPQQTRCYSTSPPLSRHAESDVAMDCDDSTDDSNRPLDLSRPQPSPPSVRQALPPMQQLPGRHFSDDEIAYMKLKAREESEAYTHRKGDLSHTQKTGLPRLFFKSK